MPSLDGATGWVNPEPLGPAELCAHVALLNFWTPSGSSRLVADEFA